MRNNDLYSFGFQPKDDRQIMIFEDFKKLRAVFGTPHRFAYLRSLVRTRPNVRSVYPPGWKFR
ncbi:MAG: hypothetical protein IPI10_15590 [Bacteroidetes bacterium]|jgi:hypothetical protein|nr:hypothetical protein [Bacteroidota bacterium]MBK7429897.1 hypothetical protein [Bacteroidota bacterium]MBK7572960.1 hypothetical protein [Bacteroidota bacterium]MBK8583976.1 hypothetical protein [Bacteroidota bacterium]